MKKLKLTIALIALSFLAVTVSCKKKTDEQKKLEAKGMSFDSTQVATFLTKHPDFKALEPQLRELYRKHNYNFVWYDDGGRNDFAEVLYNKTNQIQAEGVPTAIPYKDQLSDLFAESDNKDGNADKDLLISSMYFFYTKKVLEGVDPTKSKQTGWYLPRDKVSYVDYLDNLMKDPDLIKKDVKENIGQYYNLRKGLQKYRDIQKKGGWSAITLPEGKKSLKVGDSAAAVAQLRKRLFITGELKSDSGKSIFDEELKAAIQAYEKKHNREGSTITADLVKELNVPVEERIKTIVVNMERCRWIDPDVMNSKELIAVNIPSYRVQYIRDGKPVLISNVVVGKELNKTVVFSGQMSYLVFSPYWNIPKSIIEKEIKPGMAANKNYLEQHNMEWNNGLVRQKPGGTNSLGLVKFMFPNTNNIYLHDTPAKGLFNKDDRALSHGCVRVEKARDLAVAILKDDKNWTPQKIDAAMHAGKEQNYALKRKIPVYIAYFTAWANEDGDVSFYNDVYNRDKRLAHLLYNEK